MSELDWNNLFKPEMFEDLPCAEETRGSLNYYNAKAMANRANQILRDKIREHGKKVYSCPFMTATPESVGGAVRGWVDRPIPTGTGLTATHQAVLIDVREIEK